MIDFIIEIKELGITTEDIKQETDIETLYEIKSGVDFIISEIAQKLDTFKFHERKGDEVDYEWQVRAKSKKRLYNAAVQVIISQLRKLKAAQKVENQNLHTTTLDSRKWAREKLQEHINMKIESTGAFTLPAGDVFIVGEKSNFGIKHYTWSYLIKIAYNYGITKPLD